MHTISYSLPNEYHACPDARAAALAIQRALASIGASMDVEVENIFDKYCSRRLEQRILHYNEEEFFKRLLIDDEGYRFGNKLSELLALIRIVSGADLSRELRIDLEKVESFRAFMNDGLLRVHPGPKVMNAQLLMEAFDGSGIQVAVFDVFDSTLLERQRRRYARAHIRSIVEFGNPVSLDHGNSVINAILSIAPAAEIIPISSDSKASTETIRFLLDKKDILIVNMSRPLMQNVDNRLDTQFGSAFKELVHEKIVVKALGNAGTDLEGNVSRARLDLGLGPTGDLSAYDGKLIQEMLTGLLDDYLILAQNWTIDGKNVALSATVTGENQAARVRTVGAPGDGVYSFATHNFESGSSFAAPQVSGILALLLNAQKSHCGFVSIAPLSRAIKTQEGLVDVDLAYQRLFEGC